MQAYKSDFIPPLLEPVLFLVALGFGLGQFVGSLGDYAAFIAPAIVAIAVMNVSMFECMYGSFVRMYYQKTFDAIIATPLSVEDVIAGELLWGATKSLIFAVIMYFVILAMQVVFRITLIASPLSLLILPFSFLAGILFAAMGMCFTAKVPTIDGFNFPQFLFITPMFLFSGTFFPLSAIKIEAIRDICWWVLPLTHATNISRELASGVLGIDIVWSMIWISVVAVVFWVLAINLMKKRLIV